MPEYDSTILYRDVEGFPGYKVGSDGTVWTCKKLGSRIGTLLTSWRPMKLNRHSMGYRMIRFSRDGYHTPVLIHRLVLRTFVGPCPDGHEACHWDGDRTNNRLNNLRWDTRSANNQDKVRQGRTNRGTLHGLAKLTDEEVRFIRAKPPGFSADALARGLGVTRRLIRLILQRKAWAWLP